MSNDDFTGDEATQIVEAEGAEVTADSVAPGRILGDFEVGEKIGEGGAGIVFKAFQQSLARPAVIKVLRTHASADGAKERFLREARFASQLDHPYAAHVYAFGVEPDGLMWIAMELVHGVSLQSLLDQRGPLPLVRFVPLFERICEVVHTAHQQGVVHRDIKPSNVMIVSRAGRLLPKLLDFGIAKVVAANVSESSTAPLAPTAPSDRAHDSQDRVHESSWDGERHGEDSRNGPALITGGDTSGTLTGLQSADGLRSISETSSQLDPRRKGTHDTSMGTAGTDVLGNVSRIGRLSSGGSTSLGTSGASGTQLNSLLDIDLEGELTQAKTIMGSPSFMSPEQWREPDAIDERTDVYALGIMAFQVLEGKVPFRRKTTQKLAHAHLHDTPPHLSAKFPRELDRVIHRALAKRKHDRYDSALAFAEAVRRAAGLAEDEAEHVPRLDAKLVELMLSQAPTPLAESVAVADASRNFDHALAAFQGLVRTLCRYLGLISLCARRSMSVQRDPLDVHCRHMLLTLRERDLDPPEWLDLATNLCRPWQQMPELHLLPELVTTCCPPIEAGDVTTLHSRATTLWQALTREAVEPSKRVRAELPRINELLEASQFLLDYSLIVPGERGLEIWRGLHGRRRRYLETNETDPPQQPFIASSEGAPVLSLEPLVEGAEPTPGMPRHLFAFAGPGRSGARMVSEPSGYVRDSERVWPAIAELLGTEDLRRSGKTLDRPPYKGLSTFTADDQALFFGREREAEAVINRLSHLPLLAIVGPSGSGKSSFVFAGVLPLYPKPAILATFRPGRNPIETLCTTLAGVGLTLHPSDLERSPANAAKALIQAITTTGRDLVLVVDQFEELFTLGCAPETQQVFAEFLAALSGDAVAPVRVIVTVRDDFLIRAEQLTPLRGRISHGLQLLTTPQRNDLLRILLEPATRVGYRFEDDALPEQMINEVEGRPGALALLSFTASMLWELRDRPFHRLLRRAYEQIGGVGGALAQHAEQTLAAFDATGRALTREAFRHLVTSQGTRAVLTRAELRQLVGDGGEIVLERLLEARLLVASEGDDGIEDRIEVSHEALLSAWPRLVTWRREDEEGARLRDQLRTAARQWNERGRAKGLLWRGEALAEYRVWRTKHPQALTDTEAAFAAASEAEATRGRRIRQALLGSTILGLSVFGTVVTWQRGIAVQHQQQAEEQRIAAETAQGRAETFADLARSQLAKMQLEGGRREMLADEPLRALAYLAAARKNGAEGTAMDFLLRRSIDVTEHRVRGYAPAHDSRIYAVVTGGDLVATGGADEKVRVWNIDGTLLHEYATGAPVFHIALDPSGQYLAAATGKTARVWDTSSGEPQLELERDELVVGVGFSPASDRLAIVGRGKANGLYSFPDGQLVASLPHEAEQTGLTGFAPTGRTLFTVGWDAVRLWSADDGRVLQTLGRGDEGIATTAAISHAGDRVVVAHWPGGLKMYSTEDGRLLGILEGQERLAYSEPAFSPDGSSVVVGRGDGTARVYDTATSKLRLTLRSHNGEIKRVAYAPQGNRILTGGQDGLVRVWDDATGEHLATFGGHGGAVESLMLDRSGQLAYTGGGDGQLFAWNIDKSQRVAAWSAHDGGAWDVDYNRDGSRLLTAGEDGRVRVWDAHTHELLQGLEVDEQRPYKKSTYRQHLFAAWHPDEKLVAIAQLDTLLVQELATGKTLETIHTPGNEIYFAAWNPAGTALAFAGYDGRIYVWENGAVRPFDKASAHFDLVWSVQFSPDGTQILSLAQDSLAKIWDVASGTLVADLKGHAGPLVRGSFDAAGTRVITSSQDKTARIWRLGSDDPALVLEGHRTYILDAVFSPDGALVASIDGEGDMIVWDASTATLLRRYKASTVGATLAVAFSPDGSRVSTVGADGMARVWNVLRAPVPTSADLHEVAACHSPQRLDGERLLVNLDAMKRCASQP